MFKNYFKIALRNLARHRLHSFINITGLALGMVCCILILLWVHDELGYDRFHKNSDRLYQVVHRFETGWSSSSPWAMTPVLKKDFPEIEKATRISTQRLLINHNEKQFYESVAFVDPDFLDMFSFQLMQGDPLSPLDRKESVVISEQMAIKYFQDENPIGQHIQLDRNSNLTVTGVLKDIPSNSTLTFDMLVPIINLGEERLATWSREAPAFVLLRDNADVETLREKMAGTTSKYDQRMDNSQIIDDLFPFSRLHLYNLGGGGPILYVYIFSAIAVIVLIIACINFINLLIARASLRNKEIGMRKVLGAGKNHVILQFFGETFFLSICAFFLAVMLVGLILPSFNTFADKQVSLNFLNNPWLIAGTFSIILLTTLFAGSYPALLLSSFNPICTIKESGGSGLKKSRISWTLMVIQFAVSIILIVMTVTMNRQIDYIKRKNLGFNREQVISINLNDDFRNNFESIKNQLLQYPGITHVTWGTFSPNSIYYSNPVYWEGHGPDDYENMSYVVVDYDYLETFKINLLEGRNFSRAFSSDSLSYIVNEAAVKFMQMDSPVGKKFSIWQAEGRIIGVVKNFHSLSLHNEIRPVVMTLIPFMPPTQVFIRIKPENTTASLATIEKIWKKSVPYYPFEYEFLDDSYRRQYMSEEKTKALFQSFSLLAISISCIGLFGLAAFAAQRRTREIGIRKVVGATVLNVCLLMYKDFFKWLILSLIISIPISYIMINEWLKNFAYHAEISWTIFAGAGMVVLLTAGLTIGYQTIRAATANPVKSLRYE